MRTLLMHIFCHRMMYDHDMFADLSYAYDSKY